MTELVFGMLDVNFKENAQCPRRASKTQEAWLIGRHRIIRTIDFSTCGYQFIKENDTKRVPFPDKMTLSFDQAIKDNGLKKPENNDHRIDIELTHLNEQIIIDGIPFRCIACPVNTYFNAGR